MREFHQTIIIISSVEELLGLISLGGTGRDDISMQFASWDFRSCWIYTWVAVKLLPAICNSPSYFTIDFFLSVLFTLIKEENQVVYFNFPILVESA